MPYVNVKITKDGITIAQKRKIVADITQSLVSTLRKKPEHIHIVIDEVDPENWGFAGVLTPEYRAQIKPREKNPVTMEFVLPRLLKSKPSKRDALLRFLSDMFPFQEGVTEADIDRLVSELQKSKALRIDGANKVIYKNA
jgi:4-oxalocrotonate tautomerase